MAVQAGKPRRIAKTPRVIADEDESSALGLAGDGSGALGDGGGDDQAFNSAVHKIQSRLLVQREAQRRIRATDAERFLPDDSVSGSLRDMVGRTRDVERYLVDGICGARHNVIITAQYKAGKTMLLTNLLRSLADGRPFLRKSVQQRVVGMWSCEMDEIDLIDEYIVPQKVSNVDDFHVAHLRGHHVDILSEVGRNWTVQWLKSRQITVWGIDSLARLARMSGVDENDNTQMMSLLVRIDEIKHDAGVDVAFILVHTGRGEMEAGKERARGATVVDDWADARWIYTKQGDTRFLSVDGRRVRMEETELVFSERTNRLTLGNGDRDTQPMRAGVEMVRVAMVNHNGKAKSKNELQKWLSPMLARGMRNRAFVLGLIDEAVALGIIRRVRGARNVQHFELVQGGGVDDVSDADGSVVPNQYHSGTEPLGIKTKTSGSIVYRPYTAVLQNHRVGDTHPMKRTRTRTEPRVAARVLDFRFVDKWMR